MKTRHRSIHTLSWVVLTPVLIVMAWLALMSGQSTQPVNQALTPELISNSSPKGALP